MSQSPPRRVACWAALAVLLVLVVFPDLPVRAAEDEPVIELVTGVHKRMAVGRAVERVAVGDPEIATVSVLDGRELLLLGRAPGETTLIVWFEEGTATLYRLVVPVDSRALERALRRDAELAGITVEAGPHGATLGGHVATVEAHARARALVEAHVGEHHLDQIRVMQRQMVSVEVRFAAMAVSTLKRLGFDFRYLASGLQLAILGPSSAATVAFSPADGASITSGLPVADAFNLLVAAPKVDFISLLGALSGARLAHILAEPTLIVRSGESAEFLAGGEIPIPVPRGEDAVGIEYRKFGIQLRLAVTALSPERIVLRLSPEVSELDFARAIEVRGTRVPALAVRSATTTLELGDGQSFVLAGLISSSQVDSEEHFPLLGDIPILGNFFRRVDDSRERQELIIVATPRLVSPLPDARELALPGDAISRESRTFGDVFLGRERVRDRLIRHGLMP